MKEQYSSGPKTKDPFDKLRKTLKQKKQKVKLPSNLMEK